MWEWMKIFSGVGTVEHGKSKSCYYWSVLHILSYKFPFLWTQTAQVVACVRTNWCWGFKYSRISTGGQKIMTEHWYCCISALFREKANNNVRVIQIPDKITWVSTPSIIWYEHIVHMLYVQIITRNSYSKWAGVIWNADSIPVCDKYIQWNCRIMKYKHSDKLAGWFCCLN